MKQLSQFCSYKITTNQNAAVFDSEIAFNLLFDALSFLRKKYKLDIYGYLFLANQFNLITQATLMDIETEFTDNLKTITRTNVVSMLERNGSKALLEQLEIAKAKKKYRLWQVNSDTEIFEGKDMLGKRIELLHSRPVQTGLVYEAGSYHYSSAKFYTSGVATAIKISDYRTLPE